MIIRPATINDIPEILLIEQESFSEPWSYEALQYEIDYDDSHFEVAIMNNEIAGFCILRRLSVDAEIINVAVSKSYRRFGVGNKLIKSILDYATVNNLQSIYLEVRQSNTAAIALYLKHGFISLGIRKDYYTGPVEDAITMVYKTGGEIINDNISD